MNKLPIIFLVALAIVPFVAAQEFLFYDIAGAYIVYWQWFDLAFWVILFTSLGQYVFVQRMQMHKGLAVALGLAGGLSMLMLEYYGGVRLLILTPYFALIATAVFWIFFWHLLRAAMGEDHKVWTGILSFLLSLMMLAAFLNAFVDESIPWAHLDIAGTAWTTKDEPHRAKGATAFGVSLIVEWLKALR